MADAVWGLIGVIVGAAGKGLLDWLLAIGKVRADREARDEARRDRRHERRDDLQRQTLLDLQDAVMRATRAVYARNSGGSLSDNGVWSRPLDQAVSEEYETAHMRIRLLRSRVKDNELRGLAAKFALDCLACDKTSTQPSAKTALSEISKLPKIIYDHAGKHVLEMDDVL